MFSNSDVDIKSGCVEALCNLIAVGSALSSSPLELAGTVSRRIHCFVNVQGLHTPPTLHPASLAVVMTACTENTTPHLQALCLGTFLKLACSPPVDGVIDHHFILLENVRSYNTVLNLGCGACRCRVSVLFVHITDRRCRARGFLHEVSPWRPLIACGSRIWQCQSCFERKTLICSILRKILASCTPRQFGMMYLFQFSLHLLFDAVGTVQLLYVLCLLRCVSFMLT